MIDERRTDIQDEIGVDGNFALQSKSRLERVDAWGGASAGMSYVYRPVNLPQLKSLFQLGRETGRSLTFRGGGNSYGDAAMNDEQIIIDLRRMNRVLNWDAASGRITVEPGVTLQRLFEYVLEDGWWPPVCTGTMKITVGGGAAMNVHGKNAYKVGPLGDHIYAFDILLPSGEVITCSRDENEALFFAAIGGVGMLGCFVAITLQMKRIYSGNLRIEASPSPNLKHMLTYFNEHTNDSDYLVGWIDSFKLGKGLGRGEIHRAHYLPPGSDPTPEQTLRLSKQHLPDTLFGIVPKSIIWRFMRPFVNNVTWRFVNTAKYWMAKFKGTHSYQQPHAAYHFLLDYVPNFKRAYGPDGLIQYQCFLPADQAEEAITKILQLGRQRGVPNYLAVLKRHRPDPFLLTHGLDGFSLAMDFKVTPKRREALLALTRAMDEVVLQAGGRFYFAKDSTLRPSVVEAYLGSDVIAQFKGLKEQYDPDKLLESNLWRRLFVD